MSNSTPAHPKMSQAVPTQSDNLLMAITAIILAVLALSLGDAIIKLISVRFSLWQVYVLRSLIAIPILVAITRIWRPGISFRPKTLSWSIMRSMLLAVMWVAYYTSLPHLSLPVAAAAYYTLPIFITLFSALMTGGPVGVRGWIATITGFIGVVIILRPDTEGLNLYAFLPILAAVLYAFAMILTRTKCQGEDPFVLSLALNVTFLTIGVVATLALLIIGKDGTINPFLFGPWASLGTSQWLALCVLAAAMLMGSIFSAYAYQKGSPAIISTFDYSYLIFSVLWGMVFFTDIPDAVTLIGIATVAAAGVLASTRRR